MAEAAECEYRIAFLLVDGLGDVNLPQLANRTPLQVAHTPVFDAIAGAPQTSKCASKQAPKASNIQAVFIAAHAGHQVFQHVL